MAECGEIADKIMSSCLLPRFGWQAELTPATDSADQQGERDAAQHGKKMPARHGKNAIVISSEAPS